MDNCLLIGNGLNRCLDKGISWGDLLKTIAEDRNVSYNPEISMPLEFERIINEYLIKNQDIPKPLAVYSDVKKQIAQLMSKASLPENAIHFRLKELKPDAILTTNYDTLLELSFDNRYQYDGSTQKKYLFEKTASIDSTQFYHVHGIIGSPNSLCLGYEHYMGVVENLRSSINTKKDRKEGNMLIKRVLRGEDKPQNTWGERFYTSNIAIIGLELHESESDLWWLITHRAYLYYSNYEQLRDVMKNEIVFYDTIDTRKGKTSEETEKKKSRARTKMIRHQLLTEEHVTVKPYTIGQKYGSYFEAYCAMFEDIKQNSK